MIAIGIGLVCGAINGFILGKYRLQPFIVTMGMLSVARGLTLLTTGGNPVSQLTDEFRWLGNGYILGIPVPVLIFIILFAIAWFVLNKMTLAVTSTRWAGMKKCPHIRDQRITY